MTTYDIAHELLADKYAGWTYAGAFALAEYLEDYEDSTGEELELDVVAIRCDFSEYSDLIDWAEVHFSDEAQRNEALGFDDGEEIDEDELLDRIREHIEDNGQLIEFEGGIIVSSF